MADPIVHLTNGVPDSGTGNITTLGAVVAALPAALGAHGGLVIEGVSSGTPVLVNQAGVWSTRALGNAGAVMDFPGQNSAVAANALQVGGQFNTTPTTITSGNSSPLQLDSAGNLLVNVKTGGGSGGTSSSVGSAAPATAPAVGFSDGTNMVLGKVRAASTGAAAASDPALVVTLRDVNANGRALPSASAPVVLNSMTYKAVAASASATLLGATGASGDYLDGVLIIPATAAAGAVSITDGSGSAITIFAGGGTTALPTLAPFYVPIGAVSSGGAGGWKVTTGTNVSVIGIGNFT